MAKKQKKQTTDVDVAERESSARARPFGPMGLDEWFERWPDVFARRWPESFRGLPMLDDAFRLEQFTEDDGTFVLRAELPGVDPDDGLEITVEDGRLVIAAEREERSEDREKGAYRSEFRYGSFHRSIRLPSGADEDAIEATFSQGILEIRVPCDDDAAPARTIPVASKE